MYTSAKLEYAQVRALADVDVLIRQTKTYTIPNERSCDALPERVDADRVERKTDDAVCVVGVWKLLRVTEVVTERGARGRHGAALAVRAREASFTKGLARVATSESLVGLGGETARGQEAKGEERENSGGGRRRWGRRAPPLI